MSDVHRKSRDTLHSTARKIDQQQPAVFADYINGKLVDDRVI